MKRLDVEFSSNGVTCRAWLYLPKADEPAPVVVMAHGFAGIRELRLPAYAERFCAAGYACLVFDYRHFGASDGLPRQLLDFNRQLADWSAAVAFARGCADVDSTRIVLWGSSFSGGHVIASVARERGISAVIAQCPFTDGLRAMLTMKPRSSLKSGFRVVADAIGARLSRDPIMVAIAGGPDSEAMFTSPEALAEMEAMVPEGVDWRNEIAARVGLQVMTYRPGKQASKVECPFLACVCEADIVCPPEATATYVRQAKRATVRLYPYGHFEIHMGEPFQRIVADQVDFLQHHVPVTQPRRRRSPAK